MFFMNRNGSWVGVRSLNLKNASPLKRMSSVEITYGMQVLIQPVWDVKRTSRYYMHATMDDWQQAESSCNSDWRPSILFYMGIMGCFTVRRVL